MKPTYYTVDEAAEILRVHRKTLLKCIKNGEIPAVKVGGQYRIPAEALEATSEVKGGAK